MGKTLRENQIDLVVVGTHGRTGIRRFILGSAAEQICRIAPCPVLTVGPDVALRDVQFRRILVPTDFSEESTKILPHIRDMVREYGATVMFLHGIPTGAAVNIDARMLAENARCILRKAFTEECAGHEPEFLIEFGPTAETILLAAHKNKADLVAMGTRNSFAPGMHLHSGVAYEVMAAAHCPVLTCR